MSDDGAISNADKPRVGRPFEPGNCANPSGRPKGSRNKLGEAFLADFLADWSEHGKVAIQTMREEKPHEYVKVAASLLPKQIEVKTDAFDDLTDDQLAVLIAFADAAEGVPESGRSDATTPQGSGTVN